MNTCSNCNFWKPDAPLVAGRPEMGACNKLRHPGVEMKSEYVLPVVNSIAVSDRKMEFLTGANFGCNHYAQV